MNFSQVFGSASPEKQNSERESYEQMKAVFKQSIITGTELACFYTPPQPIAKECDGCGAPLKYTRHCCEYCGRNP